MAARKKSVAQKKKPGTDSGKADDDKKKKKPEGDGMRETVESIAIAFILAFLFRTFQAEMYVIPTGSMAPTLYGRHKEIVCPGCQYEYVLGASSEIDQSTGLLVTSNRIVCSVCPNCRRANDVLNAAAYNGDRILVNKLVSKYNRFDVVVFKNPEEGHVNYIKRLIGLPGETVRIRSGNIWARPNEGEAASWKIQRKEDVAIQKDIQLTVYDDRLAPQKLLAAGWPERWVSSRYDEQARSLGGWPESENAWEADRATRNYTAKAASASELQWLRYRHVIPTQNDWLDLELTGKIKNAAEASLISDFCGVNAKCSGPSRNYDGSVAISNYRENQFWVGDLTLNLTLQVDSAAQDGVVLLELVEGLGRYRVELELGTGRANLLRRPFTSRSDDDFQLWQSTDCGIVAGDSYTVSFANVDDRICLWVDGDLVEFDEPTTYDEPTPDAPLATRSDLAPCGIAVSQADVTVSELQIERDIYYRNDTIRFVTGADVVHGRHDYGLGVPQNSMESGDPYVTPRPGRNLHDLLRSPENWSEVYRSLASEQNEKCGEYLEFRLEEGEYLMFGDNSPASKDSRLFDYVARPLAGVNSHRYAVREQDLIGRAVYICWPHGVPFLNDGQGFAVWNHKSRQGSVKDYPSFRLPIYPNFSRMRKIR